MNFTEKLKSLFNDIVVEKVEQVKEPVVKPEKFMDIAVGDRMFRTDTEELVEGAYIFEVLLVDGQEVIGKVEDGEFETGDGVKFVVENDTIVSITMPEGEGEGSVEVEVEASAVDTEFQSAVVESFEKFSKTIQGLEKINSDMKNEMNKMKEEFSKKLEELNLPAESGVKLKKSGFSSVKKEKTDLSFYQELSKKYIK